MTKATRYPLWEQFAPPGVFGDPARTAVRAEGTRVLFADGRWRLCGTSGLWNVNFGYNNPRVADAIANTLRTASYLPVFRSAHQPAVDASRALLGLAGPEHFGRVVFSTSGGAANDLTMKLARQYQALRGEGRRRLIVGLTGSYHGTTYGSHALTGEDLGQDMYAVDRRWVRHVAHDDPAQLRRLMAAEGDQVAAVVVEPVLGSGAFPLPESLLTALDELRREHGFLLVADEVATGFARTGLAFASEAWPMRPDLLLASKGLTNGTCAAAVVLVSHDVCETYERENAPLMHGETQAGAPTTCAAIIASIDEMERLDAPRRARETGKLLEDALAALGGHPLVTGHGGVGCFQALRLGTDGQRLPQFHVIQTVGALREAGLTVQPGPGCVQLIPTLVYERSDVEELASLLRTGLDLAAERLASAPAGPSR
ncbi:aspartate aminotransferase family protein [Streptomyces althioticus]|uniref:daptide-type RiPP biosynthesis aminotransferase n=1 Tax=Streptomyces althioticus TaxID=83380 RepID=UPI001875D646|nr:aspartate aminotransferase family protein [Streptomyces althioticus]